MKKFLFYWRFHIAFLIVLLSVVFHTVMFFRTDSLLWKAFYLMGFVVGIRMAIGMVNLLRTLANLRRQANVEIPDGEIVFEDEVVS